MREHLNSNILVFVAFIVLINDKVLFFGNLKATFFLQSNQNNSYHL